MIIYLTSILLLGGFFGSIICTLIMKIIPRHNTMIIADIIGTLGCFITIIYPNIVTIFTGRFIVGIASGMNTVVVPIYIKEITPL